LERHFSTANPRLHISPDALACLFYTSGSTGQPKGVVDTHRNSLHFTRIQTNTFHICAHDRVTFLASQGRDIFQSLLNGATVYPIDITQEGLAPLAPWLLQEGVTIYYSAASVFRYFVHTLSGEEQFPALRLIVLIGEPLSKRDVELYQQHFAPHCMFVNSLGGTETLPFRYYFVDKQTQITSSVVPAGYAVADKEVLLVDEAGQAVGFNRPGEIVVKSRYLAPGYWRRPELTAMKFLPDPTGGNERLYRTGDLGVMRPDGCLIYLGRQDSQVKIRGHRIELAEIEMALLDLDTVKEAVVVAQEDVPGHQRLVGYIVPAGPATPTVSALRQALAETLPAYMIPSAFVMLDRLPLIGIGKVDRRTLPAPSGARPELDTPFATPRTPVEAALARIWAETLGLTQVGIYDQFLALGGDSLLATQIIAQIINTFRVELSLRSLFEASTIADMAMLITQRQAERVGPEAIERMLTELAAVSKAAGPSGQCLH
jgi:acyl-coenzyme A synthetase/AMP-(fatty) acid ligase/acyl carrier protein